MLSKLKRGWVLLANFSIFLTFLVLLKGVIKELLWFTHLFYINQFFFNITNCKNWAKLRIWNFNDQGRKWYFCLSIFYIICTSKWPVFFLFHLFYHLMNHFFLSLCCIFLPVFSLSARQRKCFWVKNWSYLIYAYMLVVIWYYPNGFVFVFAYVFTIEIEKAIPFLKKGLFHKQSDLPYERKSIVFKRGRNNLLAILDWR